MHAEQNARNQAGGSSDAGVGDGEGEHRRSQNPFASEEEEDREDEEREERERADEIDVSGAGDFDEPWNIRPQALSRGLWQLGSSESRQTEGDENSSDEGGFGEEGDEEGGELGYGDRRGGNRGDFVEDEGEFLGEGGLRRRLSSTTEAKRRTSLEDEDDFEDGEVVRVGIGASRRGEGEGGWLGGGTVESMARGGFEEDEDGELVEVQHAETMGVDLVEEHLAVPRAHSPPPTTALQLENKLSSGPATDESVLVPKATEKLKDEPRPEVDVEPKMGN